MDFARFAPQRENHRLCGGFDRISILFVIIYFKQDVIDALLLLFGFCGEKFVTLKGYIPGFSFLSAQLLKEL